MIVSQPTWNLTQWTLLRPWNMMRWCFVGREISWAVPPMNPQQFRRGAPLEIMATLKASGSKQMGSNEVSRCLKRAQISSMTLKRIISSCCAWLGGICLYIGQTRSLFNCMILVNLVTVTQHSESSVQVIRQPTQSLVHNHWTCKWFKFKGRWSPMRCFNSKHLF